VQQQPQQPTPEPQAAPAPAEVTIPAGTSLAVRVDQRISVKTSHAGDPFTGEIAEPITASDGNLLVPKLSRVKGVVAAAHKRGRFKGASLLELRLTSMNIDGKEYAVETRSLTQTKKGKGKRTAAFIGGGSGLGMLIGGLASGGPADRRIVGRRRRDRRRRTDRKPRHRYSGGIGGALQTGQRPGGAGRAVGASPARPDPHFLMLIENGVVSIS
jgi:hypothetical protein